jgi:ankyrin repeat protein
LLNGEGGFRRKTGWGSLSEIRELVDRGADVNAFLPGGLVGKLRGKLHGQTALRVEIGNARRIDVVEFLLKRGAGVALLHVAIRRMGPEITKLLLGYGADVDAKDDKGEPALYTAVKEGKLPLVRLLLEHGADPNIKGGLVGNALNVAIMKGLIKITETLLDHGANNGSSGGPYGDALHVAVAWGKVDIVELLLKRGADANAKGGKYGSPLQAARRSPHCKYRDRIRDILKEHGAKDKSSRKTVLAPHTQRWQ